MGYCTKCGKEIEDTEYCSGCGNKNESYNEVSSNDRGGILYFLLGFCIPIVGLILFYLNI